jgi:dihydrofolate reductase
MQMTLNNRIANAYGVFWEPFAWGEPEMTYINDLFRAADTFALSRVLYEAIVPWWDTVAAGEVPDDAVHLSAADKEFAHLQKNMTKVVFSTTLEPSDDRVVISGDLAQQLADLKAQDGRNIILGCGPATLAPLAETPSLIDEYVLVVHPAVISDGPQLFEGLKTDLALQLTTAKVFDAGAVILHYDVR